MLLKANFQMFFVMLLVVACGPGLYLRTSEIEISLSSSRFARGTSLQISVRKASRYSLYFSSTPVGDCSSGTLVAADVSVSAYDWDSTPISEGEVYLCAVADSSEPTWSEKITVDPFCSDSVNRLKALTNTGMGTASVPYTICTLTQLNAARNASMAASFQLGQNIDASDTSTWDDGNGGPADGFLPFAHDPDDTDDLAFEGTEFTGVFDGKYFSIDHLFINRPDSDYLGLFGKVGVAGTVKNLVLSDLDITGRGYVGGLAGYNDGTLTAISTSGEILANRDSSTYVGGISGYSTGTAALCSSAAQVAVTAANARYGGGLLGFSSGTVTNCSATGDVLPGASGISLGGLVGFHGSGTIRDSYATGDVDPSETSAGNYHGGFVGFSQGGLIENCYSTGKVSGASYLGGFIALAVATAPESLTIRSSFATGAVTRDSGHAGGFVSRMLGNVRIDDCYSTGAVTGIAAAQFIGGFVGNIFSHASGSPAIYNSYATGNVSGGGASEYVGGFAGACGGTALIQRSFSTGDVSGLDSVGGFVGNISGIASNVSYLSTAGNPGVCVGTSSGGTVSCTIQVTADYFKDRLNPPLSSWDFPGDGNGAADTWMIPTPLGYPQLSWQ